MIIGAADPLYETMLSPLKHPDIKADDLHYLHQFVLHSSLDMVQSAMNSNTSTYLKVVDRFNNSQVSAYVTPGGATFLLLHSGKGEDSVRQFFIEVHELYVKVLMNPFHEFNTPITSPLFDARVKVLGRKYF